MKKTKEQKGITLISLVITIILLLILATVAISLAVDSDGLFSKAGDTANKWNSSVATEKSAMQNLLNQLGIKEPLTLPEGWNPDAVIDLVKEGDRIAPIPDGYVASKVTTEDQISEGLVIYETDVEVNDTNHDTALTSYNQYVWIPVDDINDMVMCSVCGGGVENLEYDDETKTLDCTSTHAEGTTPKLCGKLYTVLEENIGMTPVTDASGNQIGVIWDYDMDFEQNTQEFPEDYTGFREPATVTGDEATLLPEMQSEFNNMAESVAKYKGFYISRYEIGTNGTSQKGQTVLANTEPTNWWYTLRNTLSKTGTSTTSQMIWGCEYDQVIKFIGEEAEVGHSDRNSASEPALSGNNPNDEMMNIYDLEGNYIEWTAEADSTDIRVGRGSDFFNPSAGYFIPAACRCNIYPTASVNGASRIGLYVNL